MKQWWEFLVLAGQEQKLSVCQRRKSLFIYLLKLNPVQAGLYLAGISAAELDLTFSGLCFCRHF